MKQKIIENNKEKQFLSIISNLFKINEIEAKKLASYELKSALRINTLKYLWDIFVIKNQIENLWVELIPISWANNCYEIIWDKSLISNSDFFKNWLIYIQNSSSFIPPIVLDPKPWEKILDMCASPWWKCSFIANLVDNHLNLFLNDRFKPRLEKLKIIMQNLWVKVEKYFQENAWYLNKIIDEKFDKILIDAQCSNEWRVNLSNYWALKFWNLSKKNELFNLQKSMIRSASKMIKPWWTIVYSTCTFSPEENEQVISDILWDNNWFETKEIEINIPNILNWVSEWNWKKFNKWVKNSIHVIPNWLMEWFFVCKLQKK